LVRFEPSTGPHLHFTVWAQDLGFIDPLELLQL